MASTTSAGRSGRGLRVSVLARVALPLALCALLAGPATATNGLKPVAYGARAAGRAGVDYAFADDGTGPATNPAGMAFVYGNRLDNTWGVVFPTVTWRNSLGEFEDRSEPFIPAPAFSFGAVFDPSKDWEIAPLFDLGRWGMVDDEDTEGDAAQANGPPPEEAPQAGDVTAAVVPTELSDEELYGGKLRLGFGVFPVAGGRIQMKKMRTPIPSNGQPAFDRPRDWETDVLTIAITPSFAYRFTKHFSAGLSLQLIYGQFELDGGIAQPSSTLADDFEFANNILNVNPQILTFADVDDAKTDFDNNNGSWGFSWRFGMMFNSRYVSIGVIYQDRSYNSDYLGRATVDAEGEVQRLTQGNAGLLQLVNPNINPALGFSGEYDVRIQDLNFPRMVGLGLAVRPHRRISLGLDYTYIHWSEVFRSFKARLSNGSNPNLDIMTSPTIHVSVPLRYENQHVIALGVTALLAEGEDLVEGVPKWALVWRAGWNYGKNPTPAKTIQPQQPTITEHHVSTGFTFHWGPLVELSAAVEYALPTKVDTPASPPGHFGNFVLSDSTQEAEILFIYLGLGVNF